MTSPIPARLRAIREFLESDIMPGVAAEMRSDMRASLKMLENMETEIDRLPALLASENDEMLRLCEAAIAAIGRQYLSVDELQTFEELVRQQGQPLPSLSGMEGRHAQFNMLLGKLAFRLSARIDAEPGEQTCPSASKVVFTQCCRFLQRQAQTRTDWQAVFPTSGFYREDRNERGVQGGPE